MTVPHEELIYRLDSVSKTYGPRTVLEIDVLQIRRGERLAVVGPSGAGKTTLLRLLALADRPSRGKVELLGRLTDGLATSLELRRRIAMVYQRPVLLKRSVDANVRYPLRLRRTAVRAGELDRLLADFGLGDLASRLATTLSGGERQRVALARVLLLKPEVLLLDEPTAHLDPANVALIEDRLRALCQERRTTLVLATHSIFQARRLADRVALLWDGRLIETAPTGQFFDQPADPRTAAFTRGEAVF